MRVVDLDAVDCDGRRVEGSLIEVYFVDFALGDNLSILNASRKALKGS